MWFCGQGSTSDSNGGFDSKGSELQAIPEVLLHRPAQVHVGADLAQPALVALEARVAAQEGRHVALEQQLQGSKPIGSEKHPWSSAGVEIPRVVKGQFKNGLFCKGTIYISRCAFLF